MINKYIILPLWFALWIPSQIVNDSQIQPWKILYKTDSITVCNYDSYPNFYRQFDSLIHIEGKLDTIWVSE